MVEEVIDGHKRVAVTDTLARAMPLLNEGTVSEAIALLSSGLQDVSGDSTYSKDVDIIHDWESRLDKYAEMRERPDSLIGISTGFPGLDKLTAGIKPQQLITFVGEAKRGKSMLTMVMAERAHAEGITPLLVSFEMSVEEQAARYDAYVAKVSHLSLIHI